jgi:CheY-like chemotaxis protein
VTGEPAPALIIPPACGIAVAYFNFYLCFMDSPTLNLILAEDDEDDCIFFREALEELDISTNLVIVGDGAQLLELLVSKETILPDVIYLDLNMPRKNGFECLEEIKKDEKLKQIPVIILSTSFREEAINQLKQLGAKYYIRKPVEFANLKNLIHHSLILISGIRNGQTAKEKFVLTV